MDDSGRTDVHALLGDNHDGFVATESGTKEIDVGLYYVFMTIFGFSLCILVLTIAALETAWYEGRLYSTLYNVTPSQANCESSPDSNLASITETVLAFELRSLRVVVQRPISSLSTLTYEDLVALNTYYIIWAARSCAMLIVTCSVLLCLHSLVACFTRRRVSRYLFCYFLHSCLPLSTAIVVIIASSIAVAVFAALPWAFQRDDIVRQLTRGKYNCDSEIFACNRLWEFYHSTPIPRLTDGNGTFTECFYTTHRPSGAWFLMIFTWIAGILLLLLLMRRIGQIQLDFQLRDGDGGLSARVVRRPPKLPEQLISESDEEVNSDSSGAVSDVDPQAGLSDFSDDEVAPILAPTQRTPAQKPHARKISAVRTVLNEEEEEKEEEKTAGVSKMRSPSRIRNALHDALQDGLEMGRLSRSVTALAPAPDMDDNDLLSPPPRGRQITGASGKGNSRELTAAEGEAIRRAIYGDNNTNNNNDSPEADVAAAVSIRVSPVSSKRLTIRGRRKSSQVVPTDTLAPPSGDGDLPARRRSVGGKGVHIRLKNSSQSKPSSSSSSSSSSSAGDPGIARGGPSSSSSSSSGTSLRRPRPELPRLMIPGGEEENADRSVRLHQRSPSRSPIDGGPGSGRITMRITSPTSASGQVRLSASPQMHLPRSPQMLLAPSPQTRPIGSPQVHTGLTQYAHYETYPRERYRDNRGNERTTIKLSPPGAEYRPKQN